MSSPSNPFTTCPVGQPADNWPVPSAQQGVPQKNGVVDTWDGWTPYLSHAELEPQEIDLLDSVKMDYCL